MNLYEFLSLKDLLYLKDPAGVLKKVRRQAKILFVSALKKLLLVKRKEGLSIKRDLRREIVKAQNILQRMNALRKENTRHLIKEKKEQASEILKAQDIEEEYNRLKFFMSQIKRRISSSRGGPQGKEIDFLLQESLREASTLGSKIGSAKIKIENVRLKTVIESMRQQVQNIE